MPTLHRPPSPVPSEPRIDAAEVRWAAAELAALLRQTSPDSPVEAVLRQAARELASLTPAAGGTVIGPFRVRAA
jgi:hypothetical protein